MELLYGPANSHTPVLVSFFFLLFFDLCPLLSWAVGCELQARCHFWSWQTSRPRGECGVSTAQAQHVGGNLCHPLLSCWILRWHFQHNLDPRTERSPERECRLGWQTDFGGEWDTNLDGDILILNLIAGIMSLPSVMGVEWRGTSPPTFDIHY